MYTPHTVTLVNVIEGNNSTMQYYLTVLHGVMLQASKHTNVHKSGLQDADAVTLFVPFSVRAQGADGNAKTYASPKVFEAMADHTGAWTLQAGGKSGGADCFFIRGEILEAVSYAQALKLYDDVFRVTSVDIRDFGSEAMRHWQVGGR